MGVVDLQQILDVLETGGLLGLLVTIILGGAREWWVYGRHYREVVQDRNKWMDMALSYTELTDRAVEVAARRR